MSSLVNKVPSFVSIFPSDTSVTVLCQVQTPAKNVKCIEILIQSREIVQEFEGKDGSSIPMQSVKKSSVLTTTFLSILLRNIISLRMALRTIILSFYNTSVKAKIHYVTLTNGNKIINRSLSTKKSKTIISKLSDTVKNYNKLLSAGNLSENMD